MAQIAARVRTGDTRIALEVQLVQRRPGTEPVTPASVPTIDDCYPPAVGETRVERPAWVGNAETDA